MDGWEWFVSCLLTVDRMMALSLCLSRKRYGHRISSLIGAYDNIYNERDRTRIDQVDQAISQIDGDNGISSGVFFCYFLDKNNSRICVGGVGNPWQKPRLEYYLTFCHHSIPEIGLLEFCVFICQSSLMII